MKQPNWEDAPRWAKHLWKQESEGRFCWSRSTRHNSQALWATDADTAVNRFRIWRDCWEYVETRP